MLTIFAGLIVHLWVENIPPAHRDILGDALWAMMIVWIVSAAAPRVPLILRAVCAYAICSAVELSQLYHAPTIDALRATTAGHLVLGSGFDPRDFAAYALGVACAALLDAAFVSRRK